LAPGQRDHGQSRHQLRRQHADTGDRISRGCEVVMVHDVEDHVRQRLQRCDRCQRQQPAALSERRGGQGSDTDREIEAAQIGDQVGVERRLRQHPVPAESGELLIPVGRGEGGPPAQDGEQHAEHRCQGAGRHRPKVGLPPFRGGPPADPGVRVMRPPAGGILESLVGHRL